MFNTEQCPPSSNSELGDVRDLQMRLSSASIGIAKCVRVERSRPRQRLGNRRQGRAEDAQGDYTVTISSEILPKPDTTAGC